jgi:hypothetical protein
MGVGKVSKSEEIEDLKSEYNKEKLRAAREALEKEKKAS